jgi:hypothetical protein
VLFQLEVSSNIGSSKSGLGVVKYDRCCQGVAKGCTVRERVPKDSIGV